MTQPRLMSTLVALNAVSGLSHLAQFGVLYPFIALWLSARDVSAWAVGLDGSIYWSGMLIGSTVAPICIHRAGVRKVIIASAALTAAAAICMAFLPISPSVLIVLLIWGGMGAVCGLATGLRWVANESWLYSLVQPNKRGQWVGWHETIIHIAQTIGPVLIAFVGVYSTAGFYWAAGTSLLVLCALFAAQHDMPAAALGHIAPSPKAVMNKVVKSLFDTRLGLGARLGLWSGIVDGVLFGMFAVYCTSRGYSSEQAAMFMVLFGLGGLVTSVPLGLLCDRYGVIFALRCSCGLALCAVVLLLIPTAYTGAVALAATLLGVLAGAGLTLTIIAATQHASQAKQDMGQAISEVSLAFTVGTMIGPFCAGVTLDMFGLNGYVAFIGILIALGTQIRTPTLHGAQHATHD